MLEPDESLNQPHVGLATFAPSAQVMPVWPPVLMIACSGPRVHFYSLQVSSVASSGPPKCGVPAKAAHIYGHMYALAYSSKVGTW